MIELKKQTMRNTAEEQTTLVQSPHKTLDQETRWAYSTMERLHNPSQTFLCIILYCTMHLNLASATSLRFYFTFWRQIIKIARLSVYNRFCSRNFELNFHEILHGFGVGKLRSSSLRGQNVIMPTPILPTVFTILNAFSMGRSMHCSIDARWSIVVVNTSVICITRRLLWPLRVPYRKNGITLNAPRHPPKKKSPQYVSSVFTMGI